MPRALISVSDKTGLTELARGLADLGWELVSTGGTSAALRDAGLDARDVSEVTRHPEMMDGRVKTLHPAVHAGILARRSVSSDMSALEEHGYAAVDMVVVNLYPFHEAVAQGKSIPDAMKQVDIGGPTMLRAAAKNHADVIVVVDPTDYDRVLAAVSAGDVPVELRRELAQKVFAHTGRYDTAISEYFARASAQGNDETIPERITLDLRLVQALRYGENPDQAAAFFAERPAPAGALPDMRQLNGKELSFNNLLDVDAAVSAISAWFGHDVPACVIIKHTTPCGAATGATLVDAYRRALASDPVSAFGGIVALNATVDDATAEKLTETFLEIVVAPGFAGSALEILRRKKNLRVIDLPIRPAGETERDYKRVRGGFLVQQRMSMHFDETDWRVVTKRAPDAAELENLRFAWRVCASVKSNAIVLAKDGQAIGIGAGQMSRVDASRIAVMKASDQGADTAGAGLASDAFFPFRDGIDAAATARVSCVIQPGGSVRDEEVIAAADEHGMAMIFTGRRVFRH